MSSWSAVLRVSEILVDRDSRQRRNLPEIEELAESIKQRGLINPIVVQRKDFKLVAGERRLAAHKLLGKTDIRVTFSDELDPGELQALEFEENVKRVDLTWQDTARSAMGYHDLQMSRFPEEWNIDKTAKALGFSERHIYKLIDAGRGLAAGNKMIMEAPRLSTAVNITKRQEGRKAAAEVAQLMALSGPKVKPGETTPALLPSERGTGNILNLSFLDWSATYSGPKFNLIHCDFPYGVGMHKSDQGSGDTYGTYEDTPEIYWELTHCLLQNLDNFCEASAHLLFWFSMDYYHDTLELLSSQFKVNPFPLVWHKSCGSGIIPDANRGPRRTYETAFLASRGDRPIVKPVANSAAFPIIKGRHMSEKNADMLAHFLRMLVDDHSTVLDPTCGSGSALRAAHRLKASRLLGLELNKEFADHADELLKMEMERKDEEIVVTI